MNTHLTHKRALVCGSSQGIGKATATVLAQLGASITLLARNEAQLEKVLAQLPVDKDQQHDYLIADFQAPDQVQATVDAYIKKNKASFQILINNTGGPPPGPIIEAHPDQFIRAMQMHLICNQLLVQILVPGMKEAQYGRIIQIISTSVKEPIPGLGVSNTTRGAVASWAKTLSGELAPFGITVNNVLPGFTETERLFSLIRNNAEKSGKAEKEVQQYMEASVPMNRFAKPEEIANVIAFLASPAASYVNGISIPVDGGRTKTI